MKERFRRFMQGRYGVDEFSRFLSGARMHADRYGPELF